MGCEIFSMWQNLGKMMIQYISKLIPKKHAIKKENSIQFNSHMSDATNDVLQKQLSVFHCSRKCILQSLKNMSL